MTLSGIRKVITAALVLLAVVQPSTAFSGTLFGAGDDHTVALRNDGTLLVWGDKKAERFGESAEDRLKPVVLKDGSGKPVVGIVAIAVGHNHTIALKRDGTLLAWGDNRYGRLGDSTTTDRQAPVVLRDSLGNTVTDIKAIAAGYSNTVALKNDGTLLAWGDNRHGQLGDGSTTKRLSPVAVRLEDGSPVAGITAITAGWGHTVALKQDGSLLAWGKNSYGQLGDGTTDNRSRPTVVKDVKGSPVTSIVRIAAGAAHVVALKNDGTLLTWGDNREGQLGDGTTVNRLYPMVIAGAGHSVTAIAAGFYHTVALKNDGTLLAWGLNYYGQLGDGTLESRTAPVVVKSIGGRPISRIAEIAAGATHTLAIGMEGSLMTWGDNQHGQLGDGTQIARRHPVVIMDLPVRARAKHKVAISE